MIDNLLQSLPKLEQNLSSIVLGVDHENDIMKDRSNDHDHHYEESHLSKDKKEEKNHKQDSNKA